MRRTILLAVAAWLSLAATAGAQATSTATPSTPGKGTTLTFDVDSTLPPVAARIPKGLTFTVPAGYKVDFAAAPKRCKPVQAKLDECPRLSTIGSGSLLIEVNQAGNIRNVNVPMTFHVRSRKAVYAVAFLSGTRVIPGTIAAGADGMALTFDPLPDPPVFPQVSYRLLRVTVEIGAMARVKVRTGKGKGKRRTRTRTVSFLRNPRTCDAGSWATTTTFTYPDATADLLQAPTACAAR